jgi:hypothetical protein
MSKKPDGMLARTQWHRVSPTMLRRCTSCGRVYPSTHSANRVCQNCLRLGSSSRARAAITIQNRDILDYIDSLFDINIALKRRMAREFDRRKRAGINLRLFRAPGGDAGREAEEWRRVAEDPNPVYEKGMFIDGEVDRRDGEAGAAPGAGPEDGGIDSAAV